MRAPTTCLLQSNASSICHFPRVTTRSVHSPKLSHTANSCSRDEAQPRCIWTHVWSSDSDDEPTCAARPDYPSFLATHTSPTCWSLLATVDSMSPDRLNTWHSVTQSVAHPSIKPPSYLVRVWEGPPTVRPRARDSSKHCICGRERRQKHLSLMHTVVDPKTHFFIRMPQTPNSTSRKFPTGISDTGQKFCKLSLRNVFVRTCKHNSHSARTSFRATVPNPHKPATSDMIISEVSNLPLSWRHLLCWRKMRIAQKKKSVPPNRRSTPRPHHSVNRFWTVTLAFHVWTFIWQSTQSKIVFLLSHTIFYITFTSSSADSSNSKGPIVLVSSFDASSPLCFLLRWLSHNPEQADRHILLARRRLCHKLYSMFSFYRPSSPSEHPITLRCGRNTLAISLSMTYALFRRDSPSQHGMTGPHDQNLSIMDSQLHDRSNFVHSFSKNWWQIILPLNAQKKNWHPHENHSAFACVYLGPKGTTDSFRHPMQAPYST